MENHKKVDKYIPWCDLDGPLEKAFNYLKEEAKGIIDPEIETGGWDNEFHIVGWVPMTEKEIERAKAARERAKKSRDNQRKLKQREERKQYERLKAKFEGK